MFNYLSQKSTKPLDEDTFIYDKRRDFGKVIEGNTKWGDSQKEGFFFMISRFLSIRNPKDKHVLPRVGLP